MKLSILPLSMLYFLFLNALLMHCFIFDTKVPCSKIWPRHIHWKVSKAAANVHFIIIIIWEIGHWKLLANHTLRVESCGLNVYRVILFNQWKLLLEIHMPYKQMTWKHRKLCLLRLPRKVSSESDLLVVCYDLDTRSQLYHIYYNLGQSKHKHLVWNFLILIIFYFLCSFYI